MHEIRGGQIVEEEEAWKAVAATLYDGEAIVALGPAKDIHERTVQRPGHNPWLWVAFTPSRYVEVPFATGTRAHTCCAMSSVWRSSAACSAAASLS